LDGTIRLIVSPGSPIRINSPTSMLLCACPVINIGVMGVSFKMRKRRETGKDYAKRGQRRRAAWLHQSLLCFALHGSSRKPLRPPHPSPRAAHRAATSSFLYFETDPHDPSGSPCSDIAALRDRLPAGGWVVQRIIPRYFWDMILGSRPRNSLDAFAVDICSRVSYIKKF
jgi:hypothetical protein